MLFVPLGGLEKQFDDAVDDDLKRNLQEGDSQDDLATVADRVWLRVRERIPSAERHSVSRMSPIPSSICVPAHLTVMYGSTNHHNRAAR